LQELINLYFKKAEGIEEVEEQDDWD
jgi:hypothetical protein